MGGVMGMWRCGACVVLAVMLLACGTAGKAAGEGPAKGGVDAAMREVLPQLAKAHADKVQLAGFVGVPLIHKVDAAVRAFTDKMGAENKALLKELEAYAKAHEISLKFEYGGDVMGQAQKMMEDDQSKAVQGAGWGGFELTVLVLEYTDYGWNRALIKTTLEKEKGLDPELRAYLEKSLKMYEEGEKEIEGLLKRFTFK